MIRKSKTSNGLKEYFNKFTFVDTDTYSKNYFRISEFPDKFFIGKNSFHIFGNPETLVKGSKIYIDVVDANGDVVYHEILNVVNKDNSRTVVVYIYPDIPVGELTVYVAGRLKKNPLTGQNIPYSDSPVDSDFKNIPNIVWVGKSVVSNSEWNDNEILFVNEPRIYFSETRAEYKKLSTNRRTTLSFSDSASLFSIKSKKLPYQLDTNSKFNDDYYDKYDRISRIPKIESGSVESRDAIQHADTYEVSTIYSSAPIFTKTMIGGILTVTNISVDDGIPEDNITSISVPNYSSSILDVLNANTVKVDNPFRYVHDYRNSDGVNRKIVIDRFNNQPSWSIEYYDDNATLVGTQLSQSFVNMECLNLEPVAGVVDYLKVRYKPVGTTGEFESLGEFRLEKQNFLIDPNTYILTSDNGLVNKNIGVIESLNDVDLYWTSSAYNGAQLVGIVHNNTTLLNSMYIRWGGIDENSYLVIYPKLDYGFLSAPGTEYELTIDSVLEENGQLNITFFDVYISGSAVTTDIIPQRYALNPIKNSELGTHIGTVSTKKGRRQQNKFYFITHDRKKIIPKIVLRSGDCHLTNVKIFPRKEYGYSQNHAKFKIPLSKITEDTELIFEFSYFNRSGRESNLKTKIYGLVFTGSDAPYPKGVISSSNLDFQDVNNPGDVDRSILKIKNGGELLMFADSASIVSPLSASVDDPKFGVHEVTVNGYLGQWTAGDLISNISFPILSNFDDFRNGLLGSDDFVGCVYDAKIMIYGVSGSYSAPVDTYVWGFHTRGRYLYPYGGKTLPQFYDAAVSNISFDDDGFSTFGKHDENLAKNYEGAITLFSTHSKGSTDLNMDIRVTFDGTYLGANDVYDIYYVGTCKMWKFSYKKR
jgi:hypothetical protein